MTKFIEPTTGETIEEPGPESAEAWAEAIKEYQRMTGESADEIIAGAYADHVIQSVRLDVWQRGGELVGENGWVVRYDRSTHRWVAS